MVESSQTTPTRPEQLLRVDEVAAILGVDPRTVKRLASAGQIPRVVLGRRSTRYRATDVDAFIEARTFALPTTNAGPHQAGAVQEPARQRGHDPV